MNKNQSISLKSCFLLCCVIAVLLPTNLYFKGFIESNSLSTKVSATTGVPVLTSPPDFTYPYWSEGNVITWRATDPDNNLHAYQISENGETKAVQYCNDSAYCIISTSVDWLEIGIHQFDLTVTDSNGHSTSDTVIVGVHDYDYSNMEHNIYFGYIGVDIANDGDPDYYYYDMSDYEEWKNNWGPGEWRFSVHPPDHEDKRDLMDKEWRHYPSVGAYYYTRGWIWERDKFSHVILGAFGVFHEGNYNFKECRISYDELNVAGTIEDGGDLYGGYYDYGIRIEPNDDNDWTITCRADELDKGKVKKEWEWEDGTNYVIKNKRAFYKRQYRSECELRFAPPYFEHRGPDKDLKFRAPQTWNDYSGGSWKITGQGLAKATSYDHKYESLQDDPNIEYIDWVKHKYRFHFYNTVPNLNEISPQTCKPGETVSLSTTSKNTGSSYSRNENDWYSLEWDFDYDGNFTVDATGQTIDRYFDEFGTHEIYYRIRDYWGCWGRVYKAIVTVSSDPPAIDQPVDITYVRGMTGNRIVWHTDDDNPWWYTITRGEDDRLVQSGWWDSNTITGFVDNLPLGTHDFTCNVTDLDGNVGYSTVLINVIELEVPTIDQPDDLTVEHTYEAANITWNPYDESPGSYSIAVNDILLGTEPWNGSSITTDLEGLKLGSYLFNCTVYDQLGTGVSDEVMVTVVDTTSPDIMLEQENNSIYQSETNISLIISDPHLDTVLCSWNNNPLIECVSSNLINETNQKDYQILLPQAVTGTEHVLHLQANDTLGNTFVANYFYTVDDIDPIITLETPTNDTTHRSGTSIQVTVEDLFLEFVQYNWNGRANQTATSDLLIHLPSTKDYQVLSVYAKDNASNWASSVFIFTVNDAIPIITIQSPLNSTYGQYDSENGSVDLKITLSHGNVIAVYVDGNLYTTSVSSGEIISDLSDGVHNITIVAEDRFGNRGKKTIVFTTKIHSGGSAPFPGSFWILLVLTTLVFSRRRKKP